MVRPVPRPPSPEDEAESAALRYWREQEAMPLPAAAEADLPEADGFASPNVDALPSGWWILPLLLLSCLAWGGIGALVLF